MPYSWIWILISEQVIISVYRLTKIIVIIIVE